MELLELIGLVTVAGGIYAMLFSIQGRLSKVEQRLNDISNGGNHVKE